MGATSRLLSARLTSMYPRRLLSLKKHPPSMSASLNVHAPGFDDGSGPDDPLNVIVEIKGFQNSMLPSKPTLWRASGCQPSTIMACGGRWGLPGRAGWKTQRDRESEAPRFTIVRRCMSHGADKPGWPAIRVCAVSLCPNCPVCVSFLGIHGLKVPFGSPPLGDAKF